LPSSPRTSPPCGSRGRANETIRREVQDRYCTDVDAADADQAAVADALRRPEADRAQTREEQRRSGEDLTASQILLSSAEARHRNPDAAAQGAHESKDSTAAAGAASQGRGAAAERSQRPFLTTLPIAEPGVGRCLIDAACEWHTAPTPE